MRDEDVIIGDAEDVALPEKANELSRVTVVDTAHPCPECETAVSVVVGAKNKVDSFAQRMAEDYPVTLDETWCEEYDEPVYIYCDSPVCSWHGVAEYSKTKQVIPQWLEDDALSWRERLEKGDLPEGVDK